MNILITGVHGFVGANLVKAFYGIHVVYGLDLAAIDREGVISTFGWNNLAEIPPVDAVIHLAGKAHDTRNQSEAQTYFDVNTGLTKNIYDYFLTSNAKKFIFFSSIKAAADRVIGDVLTEDIIPAPKGPYGESKIAAEQYILSRLPDQSEKSVYIMRPCMIHGPGNKGNLNLLYNMVSKGLPWPLAAYENRRSFTSIDNLSYVIEGLLSKDVPTGIYNICDDEALSTNELIELICRVTNHSCHLWKLNRKFMEVCAIAGTFLRLPLDSERLRKLTENYVVSNAKIKNALGVSKMPVSAWNGFEKTIRSFQK